jgi:hypothetical protein
VNLLLTAPPTTPQKPPSRQPMLWAASVYAAGIVIGYYVWRAPVYWLVAGVASWYQEHIFSAAAPQRPMPSL